MGRRRSRRRHGHSQPTEVNNAYNGDLIAALLAALNALEAANGLRAVLIRGNGRHFQAGADLRWIDQVRVCGPEDNVRASRATAEAVYRLNRVPVPTVALVQGACFGGGTGIIAACDIVIAAHDAVFSIAEVRWGLTAAIIIPQLQDAIGIRQLRRYGLTGRDFVMSRSKSASCKMASAELEAAGARVLEQLLQNAPGAVAETKALALAAVR